MEILEKILNVSIAELNALDMSHYDKYITKMGGFDKWFKDPAGREHYRLLSYISKLYNNTTLLDIGTYAGCSALALSTNKNNHVVSYDVVQHDNVKTIHESNIEFVLGDVTNSELIGIPFICLDTAHDGIFETQFFSHLDSIGWHGLVFMDDIHEYKALADMWDGLLTKYERHDLTAKGHWSGSGIVVL